MCVRVMEVKFSECDPPPPLMYNVYPFSTSNNMDCSVDVGDLLNHIKIIIGHINFFLSGLLFIYPMREDSEQFSSLT